MIAIVNYGIGNLDSVTRAFRKCGAEARVTSRPMDIEQAEAIVLPGVGCFAEAMRNLRNGGLLAILHRKVVEEKTPTLGICLGFQMFTKHSEEGNAEGLGWIDGETRRFRVAEKIPHMGWNDLKVQKDSPILQDIAHEACFYFAHSYYVSCNDPGAVLATSEYGGPFVSAVAKDHLFGVQFHPEKSHANGLQIVRNFIGLIRHA